MIIYCGTFQKEMILKIMPHASCHEIESLWDLAFLESLFLDVLHGEQAVYVLNPSFKHMDMDFLKRFIEDTCNELKNYYFAPQINPKTFTKEPVCFCVTKLDSVMNYLVEFLYLKNHIKVDFRNTLHAHLRGTSIAPTHIPKYLTNLDSSWVAYQDCKMSHMCFEYELDMFYPHPTNIHVALSNRCNLKCIMCPYHAPKYREMQTSDFFEHSCFMSVSTFEKIATYCAKHDIFLQLGQLDEPLLHPSFSEFLQIATKHNLKLNITTNGTLLKKEFADLLAKTNVMNVTFSLDAIDKESYKKIRGYDYNETLKHIEYFLSQKDEKTRVGVCFIKHNEADELKSQEFLKYWITRVDYVKFHQLSVFEYDSQTDLFDVMHHEQYTPKESQRYPCSIPYSSLFILPDSKVTFCCNSMLQYSMSSAGGGQLLEI